MDNAQILIVDDDPYLLRVGVSLLESAGHQVIEAGTGHDGLKLAREHRPDMVLLDVVLPDIDGFEVCRQLRQDPTLADSFIVFLSSIKTSPDDQAAGLETGADGYISRPISNREFLARVEAILRLQQAQARANALARQQTAIAQLAHRALEGNNLNGLFNEAAKLVAHTLTVPDCQIMEYLPAEDKLLLRAGYGWSQEEAGKLIIDAAPDTLAGHILRVATPLIIADWSRQTRFSIPNLPSGRSVASSMCVTIPDDTVPYGVLGVHTLLPRNFTATEADFLQTVAAVLGTAVQRRHKETALQASQARYRLLLDAANDIVLVHEPVTEDNRGAFIEVNDVACRVLGYTRPEMQSLALLDIITGAGGEAPAEFRALLSEQDRLFEKTFVTKTGAILPVEIHARMFDYHGRPVVLSVARDLSERMQARQQIRRRNRELALLNRIIAGSAAGQEVEIILELACRELALAFELPHAIAALLDDKKTTALVTAEYRTQDRPVLLGQTIPVKDSPMVRYLLQQQSPLVVEDAQRDPRLDPLPSLFRPQDVASLMVLPLIIKEQLMGALTLFAAGRRAFSTAELNLAWSVADQVATAISRTRLEQDQRRLVTAIEQIAESVVITDAEGTIQYVNPAFEQITGYSRHEVIGQNPRILKSGKHDATFYQQMWTTISSGQTWSGRFTNKKKDGALYTEEGIISPILDHNGAITHYVAAKRDITRELELEQQYYQSQKMDAIGQLAGGIIHDFNNLLTAINGFAELLQIRLGADNPYHKLAANILDAGQRAADLTGQLMAFSRKQVIAPQTLNLNTVVKKMGDILQRIIGENVQLKNKLGSNLWPVKIDPAQIEQVIINLAVNARDAMPRGGNLTVETANMVLDEDYAAGHLDVEPGHYVLLAVTDTGTGMSREVQTHIFEPFFTTKEKGKGTGLGLATVYGIVKQSNGHIRVYSEEGIGTTFKIYLPKENIDSPEEAAEQNAKAALRGAETILLVEDDPNVLELVQAALQELGYTVLAAKNGTEALQLSRAHRDKIHLLLTDVVMPNIQGKDLASQLVKSRPDLKTLFMSGYTDSGLTQNGLLQPDAAFLSKPFSTTMLARRVRRVLDS